MTLSLDYIRKKMGWCPNLEQIPAKTIREPFDQIIQPSGKNNTVLESNAIADYRSTGISIRFTLGILIGLAVMALFIRFVYTSFPGTIVLSILYGAAAIYLLYEGISRATITANNSAIFLSRPCRKPVVIPWDTITKTEVKEYTLPFPRWFFWFAILVVLGLLGLFLMVVSLNLGTGEISTPISQARIGFQLSILVFMLAIFYRSAIRTRYPFVLVIRTKRNKLLVVYTHNPALLENFLR